MPALQFLPVYLIVVIADLIIGLYYPDARWLSKPLIMISLGAHYWYSLRQQWKQIDFVFLLAIAAAWLGDVLLIRNDLFLYGLGSFLLMQGLYIVTFTRHKNYYGRREIIYGVGLAFFLLAILGYLWPQLGDMAMPVLVYSGAISTMSWFAWTRDLTRAGYQWIWTGTIFFIISDMTIAIHQFTEIRLGALTVMITYTIAQYLIVSGHIAYRKSMPE